MESSSLVISSWLVAGKLKPLPELQSERQNLYAEEAQKQHAIVFFGDSITDYFHDDKLWSMMYEPKNAANFGIEGDRVEHIWWRIENGELSGPSPQVAILLAGTNNLSSCTDDVIVERRHN
jgi:hypothetical protein